MKLLLTGFEPFDNNLVNPSERVVRILETEAISDVEIEAAVLPVDLHRGPELLLQAVKAVQPDVVICLGQASRREMIAIERVAINLLDFRIPDNAGNQAVDQPIVPGGPAAYFTTLPVRSICDVLKGNGIPAQLSMSAGTYLCNQVIYTLLHYLESQGLKTSAGFIHLPDLPEQAARRSPPGPSMRLETMVKGMRIAIQVISRA